eukprot:1066697-Amorphochlora_amoeboformis.AAC.1
MEDVRVPWGEEGGVGVGLAHSGAVGGLLCLIGVQEHPVCAGFAGDPDPGPDLDQVPGPGLGLGLGLGLALGSGPDSYGAGSAPDSGRARGGFQEVQGIPHYHYRTTPPTTRLICTLLRDASLKMSPYWLIEGLCGRLQRWSIPHRSYRHLQCALPRAGRPRLL